MRATGSNSKAGLSVIRRLRGTTSVYSFCNFLTPRHGNWIAEIGSQSLLVLTEGNGETTSVLEGSDILNCEDECNLFQPKPTAKIYEKITQSADVQKQLWTAEGTQYLLDNGFDALSGFHQYLLLQHGLQKLSRASQ